MTGQLFVLTTAFKSLIDFDWQYILKLLAQQVKPLRRGMNEELSSRLKVAVEALETYANGYKSFSERLRKLEFDVARIDQQNQTIIIQQGTVRIALKNIKASLIAGLAGFKDSVSTLANGFDTVDSDLQVTLGYTQDEIGRMTAQEYKAKILVPLGMASSWRK